MSKSSTSPIESSELTGVLSAYVGAEQRPSERIIFPLISMPPHPDSRPLWELVSPVSRILSFIQEPVPSPHTAGPRPFTLPGNLIPQILCETSHTPGTVVSPHFHQEEDEAFYVLAGQFSLIIGATHFTATTGAFAFAP